MTFSSPIISIFFKIVGVILMLNRILYGMATYKKIKIERNEDIYLKQNFCNQVDHKEIGRHTSICLEADRRLASTISFHTMQEVVNDTLYRELHFHTLIQITGVIVVVMTLGAFHTKYVKGNISNELPVTTKQCKIE
jgi:hypothetical protein